MKRTKIGVLLLSLIVMIGTFVNTASATSESTTEFGTFTYDLYKIYPGDRSSNVTVHGYTGISIAKPTSRVYITMDLRDNNSGVLYQTLTANDATNAMKEFDYDTGLRDLGVFSCHEARGNSSVVRYTACVV